MFTNPPSISLEVIYEQEDSFIQRLQQEQDQRRHRSSGNPSSPSHHNYHISGSSPTAVVFNSSPSRAVTHQRQFQIKTVLSFPIELFLDGNSKNIEQFKQIAAENFPFEEEKKMRQKSQSSAAKDVSCNEKIIKKLYVCFPNENSVKIIQPLKEYLNSGLYRSAQGLDKLAFYEEKEGKHPHQKHDKNSGEQAVYNRFYFVAHQLFVVYEDDLTQRPFPYSRSGMMNQAMDISDYINEQRSRQEEIDKIRRDFRLLSLARPTGSGGEGGRGGNADNNGYFLSLPVTNQQRPELSSSSLAPPQNYFQNQQGRPLQPPTAPNNQNRFIPEFSWEYLQSRYFANCPTHYDLEMEEAMRKRMVMMMMSSAAITHHNCCLCSCHRSCCCGNNNNNIPQQKNVNASTATGGGGRNGTNNNNNNNNNNSLLNQSAVSVRSAGSNISRVSGNGDRVIRFNLVNQSQQEEEMEQRGYY